jgi:hypothetical protein
MAPLGTIVDNGNQPLRLPWGYEQPSDHLDAERTRIEELRHPRPDPQDESNPKPAALDTDRD